MRVLAQPTATFEFPDVAVEGMGAGITALTGEPADPGLPLWTPAALTLDVGWAVTLALPASGDYLLRWTAPTVAPLLFEAQIPLSIVSSLVSGVATVEQCTPTAGQVAVLTLSRTRDDDTGALAGEFTASTRPTLAAVDELIARATGEVIDQVGGTVPVDYADEVQRVAAARVAGLITLSLDDISTDDSAQRRYDAIYLSGLERLKARPWRRGLRLC